MCVLEKYGGLFTVDSENGHFPPSALIEDERFY